MCTEGRNEPLDAASRFIEGGIKAVLGHGQRAGVFLVVGCFIDAIPAMIIFGNLMLPLAQRVHMHHVHFAIIGVVSLAFGLVTPPYGLCLLISWAIGQIKVVDCLRDVGILLIAMLLMLAFIRAGLRTYPERRWCREPSTAGLSSAILNSSKSHEAYSSAQPVGQRRVRLIASLLPDPIPAIPTILQSIRPRI